MQRHEEMMRERRMYMEQINSEGKNTKELMHKKGSKSKTRKIVAGIIIGSILTILTVITLFAYLIVSILTGETTSSTDIADYQDIFELSNSSGLNIFPEEITSDMKDIDFRYQETVCFVGTPLACAFLQTTYTPDAYAAEVERLGSIRKVYGGTEKTALRDEENRYPYPAYITVDNHLSQYEYALLTGENQITYIYTCIYGAEDVGFAAEYLPVDYMAPQEEWGAGYSMYIKHFDNSGGISYDTTRDEYVEVSYCHTEMVESSFFMVRVELDEQNRELIQQCEFYYYEPPKDSDDVGTYDLESDDTFWEDLKGYEFVDVELSKDRTTAIVTYLDNGEEKQWQMELTQYMKVQEGEKVAGNDKRKKTIKWIIIGCVLTVFTIITLFVLLIILFLFGGPAKKSHDVKDYHEIFELHLGSSGGLIVFPEELAEGMTDVDFSYYYCDTWNIPTVSIFLQGTYTAEEYAEEVARLENTRKVYGGTERTLLRDEDGKYPYPAYIAVENRSHAYEYALLTGDNQITYIFTVFFDREDVEFDTKYLPVDFMTDEGTEFGSGYSIYEKNRDGLGISYDMSRDEYVQVIQHHTEQIEDSSFMVEIELDGQNREIIRQCEFHYYEPPKDINDVDTYDDESDDTFWEDLKGYEFVDLELSKDRTTAIVTYLDNGEEKQWQMELTQYMKHS